MPTASENVKIFEICKLQREVDGADYWTIIDLRTYNSFLKKKYLLYVQ